MMELRETDALAIEVMAAIRTGDVERLRALLAQQPALVNARIADEMNVRRSLLHIAADAPGYYPKAPVTVAILIGAGADPNVAVDLPHIGSAETPLHWAASNDDVAVVDALLDGGADIEAPGAVFTGGAPMSDAVVFAQWIAARRLLARGARTTIWQSAALGVVDRVRDALREADAHDITNAFWHACRGGQRATAELLHEHGAEVNWVGHDHKTPLDVARESGAADLVAWLEAQGARSAAELRP